MQFLVTSGNLSHIIPSTKVANFVHSTYHCARQSFSWDFPPYLPNEGRIYMAIGRCLALPPHTMPITDASASPCGCLTPRCWAGDGSVWGVTLHLSGHGTGLEGVGAPSPRTWPRATGVSPGSHSTVSPTRKMRERNSIKRKRVLPSRVGW